MTLVKEKDSNRKKKTISWDETCIREQDKERGTRMKITEVSTPFNYASWDLGSEDEDSGNPNLKIDHEHMTEEVTSRLKKIQEEHERKRMFQEYRKKHYDEFKIAKALKEDGTLTEGDDIL
ncbi:hypothetical protein BEWA_019970 [Theileria equi strain WA]|uniref:Protein phosphatase inhibitor 2 n=1 Tax=Theileria equi strain WA TaxID=1537102 RepID=L0AVU7_THEEQ|nr:hypothetical protein BEWA_019970 [Theileria equi strain WA]AFZ79151.1 hypothetical protein BEWA_019970 [Theileria equi strain WA]|eukprot:XP_004828817.1 hypothetical protein BEWA_019970 [Theileria equi strain WA]